MIISYYAWIIWQIYSIFCKYFKTKYVHRWKYLVGYRSHAWRWMVVLRQHHCRVAPASAGCVASPPVCWALWLAHICATQFSRLKILLGSPSLCALAHSPAMALFLNSKQHNVIIKCNECDKVIQKSRLECDDNHQGIKVINSSPLYKMIPSIPETGGCSQPCPTLWSWIEANNGSCRAFILHLAA